MAATSGHLSFPREEFPRVMDLLCFDDSNHSGYGFFQGDDAFNLPIHCYIRHVASLGQDLLSLGAANFDSRSHFARMHG